MLKALIRKPVCVFILSWLLAALVTLTMVTIRWRTYNPERRRVILDDHDGFILVFWHSRIIAMPWLWPRRHAMNALQSPHPDGRLLAHTVNHLGVHTVWGSTNRNAISGLRGLKRILDAGKVAAITPDGPRGPARVAASGPVALANLTGKSIIPVAWSVDRFWRAPGWDGMIMPKPFCRGIMIWGEALSPNYKTSSGRKNGGKSTRDRIESQREKLEVALNDVTNRADKYFTDEKKADGGKIMTDA